MDVEKVEAFLAHYASKYYDPVKAKEYYERTKELKGREPALSKQSRERQSQGTAYVRNEINTKRKADLDANAAARDKLNNAAKSETEAHRARMEKLQKETSEVQEAIVNKLKAEVEKIKGELKIPANASPKVRAFLERQQAQRSNSAATRTRGQLASLKSRARSAVSKARDEYQAFRDKNTAERRANAEQRRRISETYRNDLKSEIQNIKDNVR